MSKSRSPDGDPISTFNYIIDQHKRTPNDKTLSEVKIALAKIPQARLQSDISHSVISLLLNCQYLMSTLDLASPLLWDVIKMLTSSLSEDHKLLSSVLRRRLDLLPSITKLLHTTIYSSEPDRVQKLLQLTGRLVVDLKVVRNEAYLSTLMSDLSFLLTNSGVMNQTTGSDLITQALYILCHLARGSYLATKILLAELPHANLSSLTFISPTDQLYAECLSYYMRRVNLAKCLPHDARVDDYLTRMTSLFITSVTVDDHSTMRLVLMFLKDLSQDPAYSSKLSVQDNLDKVQQLLVCLDLTEEFNPTTADLLFSFLSEVTSTYQTDHLVIFDHMIKLVIARLDAKPLVQLVSALMLVKSSVLAIDFNSSKLSSAEEKNLKFQVDQLLPSLNSLLGGKVKSKDTLQTLLACLDLLQVVSRVPGWGEQVGQTVKYNKVHQAYMAHLSVDKLRGQYGVLTTEVITLAIQLGETSGSWSKMAQDMVNNRERIDMVAETLKSDRLDGGIMKKALNILSKVDSPETYFLNDVEEKKDEIEDNWPELVVNEEQVKRIDIVLDQVTDAVSNLQVDRVVGEVIDLASSRSSRDKVKMERLKCSLVVADERISHQGELLLQQEDEISRLEQLVADLARSLVVTKEELTDIRAQHGDLSKEADSTRDRLGKELSEVREQLDGVGKHRNELEEKYNRQKEQNVQLSQDLEQYRINEEQLQGKLKIEMKAKEEMSATLGKKLKKKEQLLEEEMTQREKAEKEGEELRKQVATMNQLSKRQEHLLSKKDKELTTTKEELNKMQTIHDQIFNLSTKARGASAAC